MTKRRSYQPLAIPATAETITSLQRRGALLLAFTDSGVFSLATGEKLISIDHPAPIGAGRGSP